MAKAMDLRTGDHEPFEVVFGAKPRTKLLSALLRLGKQTFTRGEWAQEAGLTRATTNRAMAALEGLGLVVRTQGGRVPIYRAAREDPLLIELSKSQSRLDLAIQRQSFGPPSTSTTVSVKLSTPSVKVPLPNGNASPTKAIRLDEQGNGRVAVNM